VGVKRDNLRSLKFTPLRHTDYPTDVKTKNFDFISSNTVTDRDEVFKETLDKKEMQFYEKLKKIYA
jgi:hypothetical protein